MSHAAHDEDALFAWGTPLFLIAVAFSSFQVVTSGYSVLPSLVVRSLHVGFLLLVIFGMSAEAAGRSGRHILRWTGWACGVAAFGLSFYHWIFEADLIQRSGDPNTADLVVGSLMLLLLFEGARRTMGWALPSICAAFFLYVLFGNLLPAPLSHRGYGFDQAINQFYLGTEGVLGVPTYVSSTYIFLFILFGSFLEQAGMIKLFTDVALGTVGHTKGGPAKVSVISSALMGTISGSGVANVVTTGQFTIPLMKRFGYRPEFAGAVEATASMGGQIMPPVMGAVAFIMAETLNISYAEVCLAALVPALLYFGTAFWSVHLEAGKRGLLGLPKADCPDAWAAVKKQGYLVLPLAVLVYLLFAGYTPMFSGTVGLALTVVVIFGHNIAAALGTLGLRIVFWVLAGLACGGFFAWGINVMVALIAALALWNLFIKGGRETLRLAVEGLVAGARSAVPVGIACALVGVIIGTMTLTGVGGVLTQAILSVAGDSIFLSLVLTMITCLILGMGIPTIPNYIIMSSLVGPALLKLGVPLLISHMFVFYFGIMADLTPPVALAVFAASAIAKSNMLRTGIEAVRIAIAGFVVPYMAIYDNALMLQGEDMTAMAYMTVKAAFAVVLWGSGALGYGIEKMSPLERVLATLGAGLLVAAIPLTDELGFAAGATAMLLHWLRLRRKVPA